VLETVKNDDAELVGREGAFLAELEGDPAYGAGTVTESRASQRPFWRGDCAAYQPQPQTRRWCGAGRLGPAVVADAVPAAASVPAAVPDPVAVPVPAARSRSGWYGPGTFLTK
jgi:hypothetical protein